MDLTGLAICASLLMAAATALAFIWAVKKDYFHDIEDVKYQVFWNDLEELIDVPKEEANGNRRREPERRN